MTRKKHPSAGKTQVTSEHALAVEKMTGAELRSERAEYAGYPSAVDVRRAEVYWGKREAEVERWQRRVTAILAEDYDRAWTEVLTYLTRCRETRTRAEAFLSDGWGFTIQKGEFNSPPTSVRPDGNPDWPAHHDIDFCNAVIEYKIAHTILGEARQAALETALRTGPSNADKVLRMRALIDRIATCVRNMPAVQGMLIQYGWDEKLRDDAALALSGWVAANRDETVASTGRRVLTSRGKRALRREGPPSQILYTKLPGVATEAWYAAATEDDGNPRSVLEYASDILDESEPDKETAEGFDINSLPDTFLQTGDDEFASHREAEQQIKIALFLDLETQVQSWLTPAEREIYPYWRQKLGPKAIAEKSGKHEKTVASLIRRIEKRFEAATGTLSSG
jgi:hypothetical protein